MYYGACIDIRGKLCIVVGGGRIATRKVHNLLQAKARVRVISPVLSEPLAVLAAEGRIEHVARCYLAGDLKETILVFAATNNRSVNRQVASEARTFNILANIADKSEEGSFIVPARVVHHDTEVLISTGGLSPSLSKQLREALESDLEDGGNRFVTLLRSR